MKTVALVLLSLVGIVLLMLIAERSERMAGASGTGTLGELRIEPPPGIYPDGVRVSISPYQPRGRISVTTDGTTPTPQTGELYEGPLRLPATSPGIEVLRAVEANGAGAGPLLTASYLVGIQPSLPVLSIVAEPADLWDNELGIMANPSWRGRDWEREVTLTFFLDGATYSVPAGLRVDGREPLDAAKPSLRLYVRQEYGASRLEAPLFPLHAEQPQEGQSYKRLLLQAGTHEVVWSALRDAVTAEVARSLALPVAEGRFVWLFLNGESWGIYRLSERVDRFMLDDNYGLADADVVVEGDARDGSDTDYEDLIDWVAATDLRNPGDFERLAARVDLGNLTDYLVLRELFGFPAEALVAVQPAGGRWFWIYEGGSGTLLVGPDLSVLESALLRNPNYRERFAQRAADIRNTFLTPDVVAHHIDAFSQVLADVYDRERLRWPGVPAWDHEAEALDLVVNRRLSSVAAELGLVETLTLRVPAEAQAVLYVNGTRISTLDDQWRGAYSRGSGVEVTAIPTSGYAVSGWNLAQGDEVGWIPSSQVVVSITEPVTLTPVLVRSHADRATGPDEVIINEVWVNDNGTRYGSLGDRGLEGDWVELLVRARTGVDLRGWRLTDNDTITTDDEGSIVFPQMDVFSNVPCGTVILIVATPSPVNAQSFPKDDLGLGDRRLIFYVGNGTLDVATDPGFAIGTGNDNLVLLAPGPTGGPEDDVGVDFVAEGREVSPYSFGVLEDGVTFDQPFRGLGDDDGALFRGRGSNDDVQDWVVDPTACESRDEACLDSVTLVTPGSLNPGQQLYRIGCLLGTDPR